MYNLINKIGYEHSEFGTSCQDYGYTFDLTDDEYIQGHTLHCAVVCDGCGSTPLSIVGATLFPRILATNCAALMYRVKIVQDGDNTLFDTRDLSSWMADRADETMRDLLKIFGEDDLFGNGDTAVCEYLNFTVLFMVRLGNFAHVVSMGDGFILDFHTDDIEPRVLELTPKVENTPVYPLYRFMPIPEDVLVRNNWINEDFEWCVNEAELAPDEYIGIATDGLRYALASSPVFPEWESQKFAKLVCERKRGPLARLINRNRKAFLDDFTLIW